MQKETILFYIEPNRCYIQSAVVPSALQLDIPWKVAHDGEIADKETFISLLQGFLQTNTIEQTSIGIVLSPQMTFEKDLSEIEPSEQASAAQAFIESIPFENVSTQQIITGQTKVVIATNKDVIDLYRTILNAQHCQVSLVVPATIFQQLLPELQDTLDLEAMREKLDIMRQYSFLTNQEAQPQQTGQRQKQKQNPLRLVLLSALFFALLVILGTMLLKIPH